MSTALERLVSTRGTRLSAENVEAFLATPGPALVVFPGDPRLRAEAIDAAVVAQELVKRTPDIPIGVVDGETNRELQQRFGVSVFPSLVFVRDGRKVSMVAKLQDWAVYAQAVQLWLPKKSTEVRS